MIRSQFNAVVSKNIFIEAFFYFSVLKEMFYIKILMLRVMILLGIEFH
jgi:hypothetical protein